MSHTRVYHGVYVRHIPGYTPGCTGVLPTRVYLRVYIRCYNPGIPQGVERCTTRVYLRVRSGLQPPYYSRFTVGQEGLLLLLSRFTGWQEERQKGLETRYRERVCTRGEITSITRFTVEQQYHPPSPVSLLVIPLGPGPCVPTNLTVLDIPGTYETRNTECQECDNPRQYGREYEPRINHQPPRNRRIRDKKPATERRFAQGDQQSEELSFTDQNGNITVLSLSARKCQFPREFYRGFGLIKTVKTGHF